MPSDERHAHSFCPVQKKASRFGAGRKGGRGRAPTDLLRGRCQVTRRRIFSILSIISSPRSGLDRNSFNCALAVRALRSIRPDISSTTKLFYDGGPRGIACQRPSISVSLPSWHSSKFAPGMKQELKKGRGTGKRQSTKLHRRRTASVASLNKTSCPVGFPKKKTISVSQFEGTIQ